MVAWCASPGVTFSARSGMAENSRRNMSWTAIISLLSALLAVSDMSISSARGHPRAVG